MIGNELIESISQDIIAAADSIDIIVDRESSSLHFLFGDILTLSDTRVRQRVLFSGIPEGLIKMAVSRLQLKSLFKSTQKQVGITIILIDKSICYLLADNDNPESEIRSPIRTIQDDIIGNYLNYYNYLWSDSNEVTLYEDLSDIVKTDNYSKIVIATEDVYDRLQYDLKNNPDIIHELEAYQFENLVDSLLKKQGYETILTPRSKDGGKDILAKFKTPDGFNCLCLVECKKYSPDRPVGVQWIRALYGVVEQQNANLGMLVTPSRFTKGVYDFQNEIKNKISLKDFNDLKDWIRMIN